MTVVARVGKRAACEIAGGWLHTWRVVILSAAIMFPTGRSAIAQEVPGRSARPDSTPAEPQIEGLALAADPTFVALETRLANGFSLSTARETARRLSIEGDSAAPELVLLAALAHAEMRSWSAVRRLLSDREWLDTLREGEGRRLLARAYLELGDPESATAGFERAGVERLSTGNRVRYAQALGQADRLEEAARQYRIAAEADRELAGWLRLSSVQAWSAAGIPDSALSVAAGLDDEPSIWRDSTFTELARAFFVAADTADALTMVDSLSRRARARLAAEWIVPAHAARGDTAEARREAESALRDAGVGEEAGKFLLARDSSVENLRRVADVEGREGRPDRAAALLRDALAAADDEERADVTMDLAVALFVDRQYSAVGRLLGPWIDGEAGNSAPVDPKLEQRMRFLAGRALYRRGLRDDAAALWRFVAADPLAPDGPYAAFLLADIQHDRGRLREARTGYEEAVSRFPRSSHAGDALIRLGMIDLVEEKPEDAAAHFDAYRRRFPGGNWYGASTFWAARARDAAGDSARARVLYRQVLGEDPIGYYGIESARWLGVEPWDFLEMRATPTVRLRPDHAALLRRMERLRELGWKGRALRELSARAGSRESRDDRLALAIGLNEAGFSWQGTSIAWGVYRARSGIWSEDLLRAVYPIVYEPVLVERANIEKLNPTLVAALTRRESQFDRDVVSSAGATGLMQLMPATGSEVARRLRIAEYRSEQRVVPEVNLALGSRYLRELLERHGGSVVPALISYNAGPHRYTAWRRFPEFSASTDLMIDRIPFSETRRYVKAILSYRYIYSMLYDLEGNPG
ncbi:MAG: transglycosylase SLT domain-containing protein [Gemmatimonadetes bacterium]|nr:transglycosylase SLT domain-containing protein [Gemmatimonadota bacterium]